MKNDKTGLGGRMSDFEFVIVKKADSVNFEEVQNAKSAKLIQNADFDEHETTIARKTERAPRL